MADDTMPSQQKSKREKLSALSDAVVRVSLKLPNVIAAIVRQRLTDIQASLSDGESFTAGNLMVFRLVCLIFPVRIVGGVVHSVFFFFVLSDTRWLAQPLRARP